jgi:thioredoxin 1
MTTTVTDIDFQREIRERDGLALVDFWAPWCAPCRAIAPMVEQLADEYRGRLRVGKMNVDENPRTAAELHVHAIPTLVLLRDGEVVETLVGAVSKARLATKIEQHLSARYG